MIFSNNIFTTPFIIAVYAIDMYLVLAVIRLIMPRGFASLAQPTLSLRQVTDSLPQWIERQLAARRYRLPAWVPWALVFVGLMVVRHLLVLIILGIN